jgi:UDP:flavonoid glycosyltransferase YjiC (YdhE family)
VTDEVELIATRNFMLTVDLLELTGVRVLFTSIPAHGHFAPLIPLGHALLDAGHIVGVATAETFGPVVEREKFEHLSAGIDRQEARRRALLRHPDLFELPEDQAWRIVTEGFIEQDAVAFLDDAERILTWSPDVVVREEGEFSGPLVAAMAGVPWVDHGWGPLRPTELVERAAEALAPIWRAHGVEPDQNGGAYRWLYLDPCPASLQFTHADEVAVLHRIRPVSPAPFESAALPEWLDRVRERPAVYITLGTVPAFANDASFFLAAISALGPENVEIVVTVGPTGDPDALGPQPSHVHVERFVPQSLVLPHCDLAITNGGSGSTMGALAAGVPVLAVGNFRSPSQIRNGQALAESGAGRTLARADATPSRLRDEVRSLRRDHSYGGVARRIAAEIAAMPSPADVVPLIERLTQHRKAMLRTLPN